MPFLFAMADDLATPDRAEVVALLLSIGREAVDAEEIYAVICGENGEDSTIYPDTASLMREHADAFVAYAVDSDPQVRRAAIEGLGLFLDDAERAVALLETRLVEEHGVTERLLVVRTMADLALRLPAAAAPARAWFYTLADSGSTDPDTRLAALAHRAPCASDSIDDQTVSTVIGLLRQVTPACRLEQDQTRGSREPSRPCTCETEPEPDPGVPGHIAAAFDDLERHGRVHAPTTPLLTALHEALNARFDDRKVLLTEQRPAWLNKFLGTMTIPPIPATSTNPLLDVVMANTARGEKNAKLVFPLAKVLAAAEHAAAAPEHKLGYGETEATPRLWWVKDDGTYLMSNGQDPTDTRDEDGRLPHVVHADGWGPGTDARSILGGDDFRESIDLTTPLDDGTTLLDLLRTATAEGATRFLLQAAFNDHYMTLTYITE
ncbi:DUF3085 domain-containing protein [Streptomyces zaomyceticus]|uniref:DUF3085 domain-containing protein n=1 Tax=Streptomyces zaomyceticus TaxID=68286 RepID=UPI0037B77A3B